MNPPSSRPSGALRIARVLGIDVWLHWTWAAVAFYEIESRRGSYSNLFWNVAEYLALFAIVLLHEFGHALACRSVGGVAERILLWPLGGVAYVAPPQRPGAMLWSIAAGPLVNVVLLPLTLVALVGGELLGGLPPDLQQFLVSVGLVNLVLLVFNLLPIYPLDGGQILRSLLWFAIGRERSLTVAAGIGLVVGVVALVGTLATQQWWLALFAAFGSWSSWKGLKAARARGQLLSGPRHPELRCPSCGEAGAAGDYWRCGDCGGLYDPAAGPCPSCGARAAGWGCVYCGELVRAGG